MFPVGVVFDGNDRRTPLGLLAHGPRERRDRAALSLADPGEHLRDRNHLVAEFDPVALIAPPRHHGIERTETPPIISTRQARATTGLQRDASSEPPKTIRTSSEPSSQPGPAVKVNPQRGSLAFPRLADAARRA